MMSVLGIGWLYMVLEECFDLGDVCFAAGAVITDANEGGTRDANEYGKGYIGISIYP